MENTEQNPTRIFHVQGNDLKLAIKLTLQVVTLNNSQTEITPYDFYPNEDYPVYVVLSKGTAQTKIEAYMQGNVAIAEDPGTILEGLYSVEVLCRDDQGKKKRFKQRTVVDVKDVTADAGIPSGVEFNAEMHWLDGGVFLAVSGKDGRGIVNTTIEESSESGGYNIITFHYSDGSTDEMRVRNGVDGNAVLRHEPIEPEDFEAAREAGTLSENTIYLVYEEE